MTLDKRDAEMFIPDGATEDEAVKRSEIMAVGAHPDDIEVMSMPGILKALAAGGNRFFGVVATNGVGTYRSFDEINLSYQEMRDVRIAEQKKAASVGRYSGLALLNYESAEVKDACFTNIDRDLKHLFSAVRPSEIYLHNPFDRHDTHVAVCIRSIYALREVKAETGWKPERLYAGECLRGLDWLVHCDRLVLPVDDKDCMSDKILGVYKSQMIGLRRYDQAVKGRRITNATYQEAQAIGSEYELAFAVDLLPLVEDSTLSVADFVRHTIDRFRADILSRLDRFTPTSPCRKRD